MEIEDKNVLYSEAVKPRQQGLGHSGKPGKRFPRIGEQAHAPWIYMCHHHDVYPLLTVRAAVLVLAPVKDFIGILVRCQS